jgi:hypothetical protein
LAQAFLDYVTSDANLKNVQTLGFIPISQMKAIPLQATSCELY